MIKLEYTSNNSGGYWWLSDEDWHTLEDNGWNVHWFKNMNKEESIGAGQERFLGCLAKSADKLFETEEEGIKEFEDLTGQNSKDEGCSCCGNPHDFEIIGE